MKGMAQHLLNFDFIRLFNELGWDQLRVGLEKEVDGHPYPLEPVAIKGTHDCTKNGCSPGSAR
jgi:hypothetical protein